MHSVRDEEGEQCRRLVSNGGEAGRAAHQEGRDPHVDDRHPEAVLAPEAVTNLPENNSADGAGDESDRRGEEGGDDAGDDAGELGAGVGKEESTEDEARSGGVVEEPALFHNRAGHGGSDELAKSRGAGRPRPPVPQ